MSFSFNQRYFTLALPLLIVVTLAVLAGCGSTSAGKRRYSGAYRYIGVWRRHRYSRADQYDRHWVVRRCGQRFEFLVLPVDADREGRNNCHL